MHRNHILRILVLVQLVKKGASQLSGSSSSIPLISADVGSNLTIPCGQHAHLPAFSSPAPPPISSTAPSPRPPLMSLSLPLPMWIRNGRSLTFSHRTQIQSDGSLFFARLDQSDAGIYICVLESDSPDDDASGTRLSADEDDDMESDVVKAKVQVRVRTPPPALSNVTVHPSTVLALVLWELEDDGGYPVTSFQVKYRLAAVDDKSDNEDDSGWHTVQPDHISPSVRQIDVYHLRPNSSYVFEVWANNQLGQGEVTQLEATTQHDPTEIELAHHLLQGVEDFDTRVWVVAVSVVMGTLLVLGLGTCYVLYRECSVAGLPDGQETIELVPHIILNPGYDVALLDHVEPDENSNDQAPMRINNNTVVQPVRV